MQDAKRAVQLLLLCILLLSVTGAPRAQEPAEPPFTLKQVGPSAWAAISNPKAKAPAGANAGFLIGDDGVAVIDTFASTEAAKQLLAEIRKLTKVPVKFVINTHYHLDHVAGNGVFADVGAALLAQRNVRGWIHSESLRMLGKEVKPEQKAFIDFIKALRPPTVVYDNLVADAQAHGRSGKAIVEAVMPTLTEKYGQWGFFKYFAEPNILETDAELSGKKRIPQAQRAK